MALASFKRRKNLTALSGEREQAPAGVSGRSSFQQQLLLLEAPQNPAKIAGIEVKILTQLCCTYPFAVRNLVENADFGQRQGTVEQAFPKQADLPGVEAIEAADGIDV